jgi:transcriptional regulator
MFSAAIEFWVIVQVVVDLLLIILFIGFARQLKASRAKRVWSGTDPLPQVLEPLLKEAEKVAGQFEAQLKQKQHLIRRLNEHLDNRIISLNLLLSRAEVCLASHDNESKETDRPQRHVYDLQQEIIALGAKGLDSQEIANRMGISKGEVTLVLELKRKFQEMEKSN